MEAQKRLKTIGSYLLKPHNTGECYNVFETVNYDAYPKFLMTTLESGSRHADRHAR